MDKFVSSQLRPAETCIICTEPFNATRHFPVALPCRHIFGIQCIKRWFKDGKGNTDSCPTCRHVVVERKSKQPSFDAESIWKAVCEQHPERLNAFMMKIWPGLQSLWRKKPNGKFSDSELLSQAVMPALIDTAHGVDAHDNRTHNPVLDCYKLVAATWDSLGRPNRASGLAIPLVRLARLMSSASTTLPKWLTTHPRTNRLIWRANACLGLMEENISWDFIIEASQINKDRYLPLLNLYTVLISQSIAHNAQPSEWPTRRHEMMNLVVERCCTKISRGCWSGKPTNQFKDALVKVYEELRRFQIEKKKMSLRGHDGEQSVVSGLWALAGWS